MPSSPRGIPQPQYYAPSQEFSPKHRLYFLHSTHFSGMALLTYVLPLPTDGKDLVLSYFLLLTQHLEQELAQSSGGQ